MWPRCRTDHSEIIRPSLAPYVVHLYKFSSENITNFSSGGAEGCVTSSSNIILLPLKFTVNSLTFLSGIYEVSKFNLGFICKAYLNCNQKQIQKPSDFFIHAAMQHFSQESTWKVGSEKFTKYLPRLILYFTNFLLWLVVCFEDLRRFSDLSATSRLGSRR